MVELVFDDVAYDRDVRAKAVELRRRGLTYREIRLEVGVAQSTLSQWLRDVPLTSEHQAAMQHRARGVAASRADTNRALRTRRRAATVAGARAEVGVVGDTELFVAGVVAYWAEGAKPKRWRHNQPVQFANSDAGLVRLFLAWLRLIDVGDDRLGFRVMIHESADVSRAVEFWSGVVGVPASSFTVTLKRHNPRTVRKNTGAEYHGCLVVTVRRSSELNLRISGWCEGLLSQVVAGRPADTLASESEVV